MEREYFFTLVRTFDSGNIGASLRAITNMGIKRLYVVEPIHYEIELIKKFAAGTKDRIDNIVKDYSLDKLKEETEVIYAFSARKRKMMPHISIDDMKREIEEIGYKKIGFLFGNETNGLNNDELKYAFKTVSLPTSTQKPSLNLSQAVLLAAYETQKIKETPRDSSKNEITVAEREQFFENFHQLISKLFFQKEIHDKNNKIFLFNMIKKWPLFKNEFTYMNNFLIKLNRFVDECKKDNKKN